MGINRLSIGVQSFLEEDLLWMNRAHNATQAIDCIKMAKQEEFYEYEHRSYLWNTRFEATTDGKKNVKQAIDLAIPHLSCYALTVEAKTPLNKMISRKEMADVNPDDQATEQFMLLMDWLNIAGYEHYEISNFARPGKRSRHNSSYWQGKKYLGLGPSAHSYNGSSRQWNIANNALYIQSVEKNSLLPEKEELTQVQQ